MDHPMKSTWVLEMTKIMFNYGRLAHNNLIWQSVRVLLKNHTEFYLIRMPICTLPTMRIIRSKCFVQIQLLMSLSLTLLVNLKNHQASRSIRLWICMLRIQTTMKSWSSSAFKSTPKFNVTFLVWHFLVYVWLTIFQINWPLNFSSPFVFLALWPSASQVRTHID